MSANRCGDQDHGSTLAEIHFIANRHEKNNSKITVHCTQTSRSMITMQRLFVSILVLIFVLAPSVFGQDKVVVIPKQIAGAPFSVEDDTDLFAKAYRFFIEGDVAMAADSLRKLIDASGYKINP